MKIQKIEEIQAWRLVRELKIPNLASRSMFLTGNFAEGIPLGER